MPWFVYNAPGSPFSNGSYTIVEAEPLCSGSQLCAVYAPTQGGTSPQRPNLSDSAITDALYLIVEEGQETEGITKSRDGN